MTNDSKDVECVVPETNRAGFLNRALSEHDMLEVPVALRSGRVHATENPLVTDDAGLQRPLTVGGGVDFDEFKDLIDHGYLVCMRTRRGSVRHFIIVYGCQTYPEYSLLIWDPAQGPDVIEADRFVSEYGPFTHKIISRRPGGSKAVRP